MSDDEIIEMQEKRLEYCKKCSHFQVQDDITICTQAQKAISTMITHETILCPIGEWE